MILPEPVLSRLDLLYDIKTVEDVIKALEEKQFQGCKLSKKDLKIIAHEAKMLIEREDD